MPLGATKDSKRHKIYRHLGTQMGWPSFAMMQGRLLQKWCVIYKIQIVKKSNHLIWLSCTF